MLPANFPALRNKATPAEIMSEPTKYLLVSLPTSIVPSNDKEEALTALRSTITTNNGAVAPFKIPEFKIGTLDALVQQADDLAKLENACNGVVAKVGDSLRALLEGDEAKISQQKTVNDSRWCSAGYWLWVILTPPIRASRSIPTVFYLEQSQVSSG